MCQTETKRDNIKESKSGSETSLVKFIRVFFPKVPPQEGLTEMTERQTQTEKQTQTERQTETEKRRYSET